MIARTTILTVLLLIATIPAYSQTFCSTSRNGNSTTCIGDNNEMTIIQRNGQDRSYDRGYSSRYGDSVILGESQSYKDEQRRSDERRREMIYGDDRRERERSRSRYDEER
jgi:hypothetical protein